MRHKILTVTIVMMAMVAIAISQEVTKPADHGLFTPGDIKWVAAPNALPAGAKLAVLEGNPFNPGLYTMRLSMPAGYKIPAHWHAKVEHVTVISGKFNLGMGEKFDESKGNALRQPFRRSSKKSRIGSVVRERAPGLPQMFPKRAAISLPVTLDLSGGRRDSAPEATDYETV